MRPIDRTPPLLPFDRKAGTSPRPARSPNGIGGTTGRALIALTKPREAARPAQRQVDCGRAAFVAQLIAVNQHLPQTRERRRAAPGEAVAAYTATMQMSAGRQRGACAREA